MIQLNECKLFAGIPQDELDSLRLKIVLRKQKYTQGEIVAFEGDACTSIGIILHGGVSIQQLLPSGKKIIIDTLHQGDSFGEVIIFSEKNSYPASIEAAEPTQIAFISKGNVLSLCIHSTVFLNNFVSLLSNKILMLNRKVKSLSLQSPRHKTINYILENYREQKTMTLHFNDSRNEMAEKLGLPRPSLSREFARLKAYGWIDFQGGTIKILDLESLEADLNGSSGQ